MGFNLLDPNVITVVGERILKGFRLSDNQLKHVPPFLGKHREPGVSRPPQPPPTIRSQSPYTLLVAAPSHDSLPVPLRPLGRAVLTAEGRGCTELPVPLLDA